MAGRLLRGSPYADDIMNLPVADVEGAIPYYVKTLGFTLGKREEEPISAVLSRDDVAMKIVENGGDPTQEGAFFEVDDVEVVFENFKANGLDREDAGYRVDQRGEKSYRVFFVVAPDQLCYCFGQDVTDE